MDDLLSQFNNLSVQSKFAKDIYEKCIYPFEQLSDKYSRQFIYLNWNDLIQYIPSPPTNIVYEEVNNNIIVHTTPKIKITINQYHLTYKREDELPLRDGTLYQIFNIQNINNKVFVTPLLYEKISLTTN